MSFNKYMKGYDEIRTLVLIEDLYAWKMGLYAPPVMVELSPTHSCNQKCRYCYSFQRENRNESIDGEVLKRIVAQIAEAGARSLLVQGTGEPLLHHSIGEAIRIGHTKGLAIGLTTNGVLFNEAIQNDILDCLFQIKFSVLESDPKRYAFLHGTSENQWESACSNIKNAVAARDRNELNVGLWCTIYLYKGNISEAYSIVKFCKEELGLDYVVVQEPTYTGFSPAGRERYPSEDMSTDEIDSLKRNLISLADDNFEVKVRFPINDGSYQVGMKSESWRNNFCHGVKLCTLVSSDGEVYSCWRFWGDKKFSYGSVYEKTFEEIWKGDKRKYIEQYLLTTPPKGDECAVCNVSKVNDMMDKCVRPGNQWKYFIAGS